MPFVRLVDRRSDARHKVQLTVSEWPYHYLIGCTCSEGPVARLEMSTDLNGVELSDELMRLWRTAAHNARYTPVAPELTGSVWVWVN